MAESAVWKAKEITERMNSDGKAYGPANPHPLSQLRTELVWEGKYDEYGNRREVDIPGHSLPMQKIETIDQPRSEAAPAGRLDRFERKTKRLDDFRNTHVAHQEKEITEPKEAQQHLVGWIKGLKALTEAG